MKPCPFCGKEPDLDDLDTLHPSGIYWTDSEHGILYRSHQDRGLHDHECYEINCIPCSLTLEGDSKEEVIEKWETRC
jgi:hypothetical protein